MIKFISFASNLKNYNMRKYLLLFVALLLTFSMQAAILVPNHSTAATATLPMTTTPSLSADNLMVPLFKSGKSVSLSEFMNLTPSEYKDLTGEKMSFKERIELKLFQHRFKNAIAKDGTIDIQKFHQDMDDNGGFNIGWFLLGFLLGLLGLIISLLIFDDNRQGRIKWTLIGFGAWIALLLLISL
jgi:hypothetical protein